jgi:hypothetical protein
MTASSPAYGRRLRLPVALARVAGLFASIAALSCDTFLTAVPSIAVITSPF